eukprot:TRINITY_DN11958_c0_g1_i1.p1 TRINITY_DN11958_c0_g1~~TRINITY_DN11958_c0_g1_i1.p1  ORF type:complete len:378 (+),score=99.32 TRINITY_DN11958_c0_g1_i1:221-1354(+)
MPSQYLLVSFSLKGSKSDTWKALEHKVLQVASDNQIFKLDIPDLRVGTLDSLLALSDDLVKANNFVEGVTHKIRRQLEELDRTLGESSKLTVDEVPLEQYITRFKWNEAKYPVMTPLREIVDTIHESVAKLEDDLKVRVAEYNSVKSQLSALARKAGGSMAVKDLSTLVKPEQIISTEHLTTLVVVVSKFVEKDWWASYETLSDKVVPRSSAKLGEDNEAVLVTVTLFRKVADTFKGKAREKGFQVRDFEFDPEGVTKRKEELDRLTEDSESMRSALQQWCLASYGEVFSAWMHIEVTRVFVESILRYGLPPAYQAAVISLNVKHEKRLRTALDQLSSNGSSSFWKGNDSDSSIMAGLTGGETELHPYVSVTMNLVA